MTTWTLLTDIQTPEKCDRGERLSEEIRRRLEEHGFSDERMRAWEWWKRNGGISDEN